MNRFVLVRELVKDPSLRITDIAKQTGYNKGHVSRLRKEAKSEGAMTKLEAWKAWCESAGTPNLATEFTLEQSSHGKAFSFAWERGFVYANDISQDHIDETAKQEHEPVAFINVEKQKLEWAKLTSWHTPTIVNLPKIPLYTAPPKREWVGLTEEEINSVRYKRDWTAPWTDTTFARAIEEKLKEKNT